MRSPQSSRNRRELSPFSSRSLFGSPIDDFFREMDRNFRDIDRGSLRDRLLEERGSGSLAEFNPSVDIEESDEIFLISADLPGIKRDDIKIDVSGNTLRISGERSREVKEEGYYERSSGRFSRSFSLPEGVDAKKIEASFEDGVLRVALPKTEVKEAQEVKIQSGQPQGLLDRFLHREKTVKAGEQKSQEKGKH
ncbi:Hsp20/alpha crystallin family protein [Bdellovibrio sp. HCB337]|uniref:Hsp20/alpha crystallin family protein n=1 Tax=Bdellovibrio sp. HCB337 TaxID=3394358 RepID=UPI0039A6D787